MRVGSHLQQQFAMLKRFNITFVFTTALTSTLAFSQRGVPLFCQFPVYFSSEMNPVPDQTDDIDWEYFRKLRDFEEVNEEEEMVIQSKICELDQQFEASATSIISDDMNAMERVLHLNTLRDEISHSIFTKIKDVKDKMLVSLLYKVCNNMDSTRMTFIRFAIMLHQHGILNDLNFLMDGDCIESDHELMFGDDHQAVHQQQDAMEQELEDQFSDPWSDEEHDEMDQNAKSCLISNADHSDLSHHDGDDDGDDEQNDEFHSNQLRMHSDTEDTDQEIDEQNINTLIDERSSHFVNSVLGGDHSNYSNFSLLSTHSNHIPSGDSKGSTHSIQVGGIADKLSMVTLNSLVKEHNSIHRHITTNNNDNNSNNGNGGGESNQFHALTPSRSTTSEIMGSRYLREFEEFEQCGFGTYGTVHRVRHKLDSAEYAIKKILYKHDGMNHDEIKEKLLREVTTIAQLNHVNVVRYFTAWIEAMPGTISTRNCTTFGVNPNPSLLSPSHAHDDDIENALMSNHDEIFDFWQKKVHYSCLFLQTEFCGNYALSNFIRDTHRVPDRDDNMHLFSQILLGVAHIHSKGLLHRDLKPENIFLESNNVDGDHRNVQSLTVKIGDFGLSKSIRDSIVDSKSKFHHEMFNSSSSSTVTAPDLTVHNLTANLGTAVYAAPEQLSSDSSSYDFSADIYSLGIILFELIQPPFETMMERRMAISKYRKHHEIDDERVDIVRFEREIKIMNAMTHKEAAKRPSANELLHLQFITTFWIRNVLNGAIPPIPEGTQSMLQQIARKHRSIEFEQHSSGDDGGDSEEESRNENGKSTACGGSALHHCDSIQVSVVQSPNDSGKSSSDLSSGSESDRKRKGSSSSPVYLVTSPCGSPQQVTVPWVPQMSPFCMDQMGMESETANAQQTEAKEHHH